MISRTLVRLLGLLPYGCLPSQRQLQALNQHLVLSTVITLWIIFVSFAARLFVSALDTSNEV